MRVNLLEVLAKNESTDYQSFLTKSIFKKKVVLDFMQLIF